MDMKMVYIDIVNGGAWEKDENPLVLTSSKFGSCQRKYFFICEYLRFGKEAMPIPCVIDEDLIDTCIYALYKEGKDINLDTSLYNFTYIIERLLDPSLSLDRKVLPLFYLFIFKLFEIIQILLYIKFITLQSEYKCYLRA